MTENDESWINCTEPIWEHIPKPCKKLGWCPYGAMVEMYPLEEERGKMSCLVYGHNCPVFYMAEPLAEQEKVTDEEEYAWTTELENFCYAPDPVEEEVKA